MPIATGQGGTPNALPGRGYPEFGTNTSFRDTPDDWVGGARGPAALPSRTTVFTRPAPADMRGGWEGTISYHRGAYVEDAAAPRLNFTNVLGHGDIAWRRPMYANVAGLHGYHPPTQMPSWTANSESTPGPVVPIPVSNKRITNWTNRPEYGQTNQRFNTGSLAEWVRGLQDGMNVQGKRWLVQAKTHNPRLYNLQRYGVAGSYGQTTKILNTAPQNVPTGTNGGMVTY